MERARAEGRIRRALVATGTSRTGRTGTSRPSAHRTRRTAGRSRCRAGAAARLISRSWRGTSAPRSTAPRPT
jgi:hypothetical protein